MPLDHQLPPAKQAVLDQIASGFKLSQTKLHEITQRFLEEYALGLSAYNHPLAMIPTYVTGVPDGSETGTFLALDLGGTNLRVCEIQLHGDKTFTLRQQKYKVSEALKTGEASALFDYLADSVDHFLTEISDSQISNEEALSLGLTFSFPVEQSAIDKGILLTWTKGFAARNAVGKDVVGLLQDAFDRKHLHVKCVALVNDTVGAMLSRAYASGDCMLGAIFGTGTNGAFAVKVEELTKLGNDPAVAKGGLMILNTEWGAFNNSRSVLPSTPFDQKVDRESINPTFQAFEKFISGLYLGEITRNLLLSLVDSVPSLLFSGLSTPTLNSHYGFDTAYMSAIENAKTAQEVKQVLVENLGFKLEAISDDDAAIVRWACETVATRGAYLSGCAVAATMIQTGHAQLGGGSGPEEKILKVGVDGSLAEHYPGFQDRVRQAIRLIVGEEVESRVEIAMAKDGSGVGAALCALQALKQAPSRP
ncbi:hypothetical protein SISNIDRAFT_405509 [Sistotremastrum niveocremeum HHB9708]|uniref:Phosphotransferase n=1 Tax=Sistotremastrum niveocremeum HHB9708 TaxID=1314777 RepID=A0A164ZH65_9AGAM|nr:hypothetical protein SISNIDRAFT_405509 [Sistotremastrum niveocremeum HHB9708]